MKQKKRKYIRPTKNEKKVARVLDDATLSVITTKIGVMTTCLEAVAHELDELNEYGHCIVPTQVDKNGVPFEFHSILPPTLSGQINTTIKLMDKVLEPMLSKNEATFKQTMAVSSLFTDAIAEVTNRYSAELVRHELEMIEKIKVSDVCHPCGVRYKEPEPSPSKKGSCVICGDSNVDVRNSSVYNFCGYGVKEEPVKEVIVKKPSRKKYVKLSDVAKQDIADSAFNGIALDVIAKRNKVSIQRVKTIIKKHKV